MCLYNTMNDYTFEQYDNARETRDWYERFLREHNGSDWRRKLTFSIADLLTGNLPKSSNGDATRIFWYRIKYKGVLVGYADAKIHAIFNGGKVISDVWIKPPFRKRGYLHGALPALVRYTDAVGICIMLKKYQLYSGWLESLGFDWLCEADLTDAPDNPLMFLVTRDAYKDMVRFMTKYADGIGYPRTERGRLVFEEVRKELENENT
jgi:hypothetical protein